MQINHCKNSIRYIALLCALVLCAAVVLTGCDMNLFGGSSQPAAQTEAKTEVTKITLSKQTAAVYVGKSVELDASVTPPEAADTTLTWSSSDDTIALVNSEGNVTGVAAGYVNIICRASNGVEASCTVTVKEKEETKKEEKSDSDSKSDSDKEDNSKSDSAGSNTIINNYYGHFNPSYTYNPSDFVFPDSSVRKLSYSEISATLSSMRGTPVSSSFAQDAINEIYARNGYIFKTDSIRVYYESKPWYYEDPYFTTGDFNEIEKYNIDLLTDY